MARSSCSRTCWDCLLEFQSSFAATAILDPALRPPSKGMPKTCERALFPARNTFIRCGQRAVKTRLFDAWKKVNAALLPCHRHIGRLSRTGRLREAAGDG